MRCADGRRVSPNLTRTSAPGRPIRDSMRVVKARLSALSGGVLRFDDFVGYGAGSDCDFITHVVEAVAAREPVRLFPGDWHGFRVGSTQLERISFSFRGD